MTRPNKKSSPSKPSVVEAAWDAFYRYTEVEDLQALNAEGWKTLEQVVSATGRSRNTIDGFTIASSDFERRSVRLQAVNGAVRRTTIVRPKLKG